MFNITKLWSYLIIIKLRLYLFTEFIWLEIQVYTDVFMISLIN